MSPRAAWRLESLGYHTYDYVAGKADWLAYGLPYEGHAQLLTGLITTDVPTCDFQERMSDVRRRLDTSRLGMVVALDDHGVVMGRLDRAVLEASDEASVAELMYEGPTTVRPSEELEPLVARMRRAEVDAILVTSSDGRLLGILERRPAEQSLSES